MTVCYGLLRFLPRGATNIGESAMGVYGDLCGIMWVNGGESAWITHRPAAGRRALSGIPIHNFQEHRHQYAP